MITTRIEPPILNVPLDTVLTIDTKCLRTKDRRHRQMSFRSLYHNDRVGGATQDMVCQLQDIRLGLCRLGNVRTNGEQ